LTSDDGCWWQEVDGHPIWGLTTFDEVVNPDVVCPDPNLLEWKIVNTYIKDGTARRKIVVIHIHGLVFVAFGRLGAAQLRVFQRQLLPPKLGMQLDQGIIIILEFGPHGDASLAADNGMKARVGLLRKMKRQY
jgi:hypothetical protein